MSSKQEPAHKKGASKQTMLKEIALKLSQALPSLKEDLGEKKFEKRIKKAAKLLGGGIKLPGQKKADPDKSPAKKSSRKKIKVAAPSKKKSKMPAAK